MKDAGEPGSRAGRSTPTTTRTATAFADAGENTIAATDGDGRGRRVLAEPRARQVHRLRDAAGRLVRSRGPRTRPAAARATAAGAITLASGDVDSGNDFGNYRKATKSGVKFEDLDADGVKDAGEPGLSGWTINAFADTNSNGILDAERDDDRAAAMTNGSGAYSMNLSPAATWSARRCRPAWTQSFPSGTRSAGPRAATGSPGLGQVDSDNDFGNGATATKSGVKFND